MNRAQRIVLIVYCLLLAYCCVWIPWQYQPQQSGPPLRLGYGWVWAGPQAGNPAEEIWDSLGGINQFEVRRQRATPNIPLIVLRLTAATALGAAAMTAVSVRISARRS